MNISVILANPNQGSFCHAIAAAADDMLKMRGHTVTLHDLYREQFDPLLHHDEIRKDAVLEPAIAAHCEEIRTADGIVIVHPNWWGQPPAILKGWIDRVIRPGVAYEFLPGDSGEGVPRGLLRARAAVVFNTSNTGRERELAVFGDPLETLWKNCIFGLCGVSAVHRRTFSIVVTSTAGERRRWLDEARTLVQNIFSG